MTHTLNGADFQALLQRLDGLIREAQQAGDPAARARWQQIVQAVLEVHGAGLERLLEHVAEAGEPGRAILDACARDDVVGGLLLLHNVHPLGVEARVERALEAVRPYLRSHGGNVELLEVRDGVVRLRLAGSCHSCPSAAVTMQQTVEEAIFGRAPEVTAIEVEGPPEASPADEEGGRLALPLV